MGRLGALGAGVLLGGVSAALYLTVLTGSPGALLLAYVAQLPLFVAGLWLGVGSVAAAGITAAVALLASGGVLAAVLFAGLYAGPAIVLVRQALLARPRSDGTLEWYPPGLLTVWLTLLGLAALAGATIFLGGASGTETVMRQGLTLAVGRSVDQDGSRWDLLVRLLALVTPGTIAASWMVMTASNAILAQGVLARFGAAWRPSPDFAALALPGWLSGLLAVAAAAMLAAGTLRFFGVGIAIVLSVPFCLAGLALLHLAARRLSRPHIPLVAFYVLAGLLGWPLLIVTALGVLDAPLGLRRRFAPP